MNFKTFLFEMSSSEALSFFSLKSDATQDEIKNRFRELSKKHHPDLGGSEEMMKKVNDAYATLKKYKGSSSSSKFDWDKMYKEYRELGEAILKDLHSKFKKDLFISYFKEMTGEEIEFNMLREYPAKKDKNPSFAGFECEFFTKDKNTIFSFSISTTLSNIKHSSGLGSGDVDYQLIVTSSVLAHNKKHKLGKSEWKWTENHKVLSDPKQIFPTAKVAKIVVGATSMRKFSKRDMITVLVKKLGAYETSKDMFKIPLNDDFSYMIYRSTMMRVGIWGFNSHLYKGLGAVGRIGGFVSFEESEETANKFVELTKHLKKLDKAEQIIKAIEKFMNDNKRK